MKIKFFFLIFVILFLSNCLKFTSIEYQTGIASYYGKKFDGNKTSSGEFYNMYGFTAAHKELPFGTIVKVLNIENEKTVVVRINDRGPFVKNRIIDLSYNAARQIGLIKNGTASVKLFLKNNMED